MSWRRAAAAVVIAPLLACQQAPVGPAPPDPDRSTMERPVAEFLGSQRQRVLDDPESAAAWGGLAQAYHAHGLHLEAAACYARARELAPEVFRWAYLSAIAREATGASPDELIEHYGAAATLEPDDARPHLRLGRAMLKRGRHERAREAFAAALERDPGQVQARRALGQTLLALEQAEAALGMLLRAAQEEPRDGATHSALAQAYRQLGQQNEARRAAGRAAALTPRNRVLDPLLEEVEALGRSTRHKFARAQRLLDAGEPSAAIEVLDDVRATRPDDADVEYLSGVAQSRMDRPEAASGHLRRALELKPDHVRALVALAALHRSAGDPTEALALLRRAHERSPQDPTLLAAMEPLFLERQDLAGLIEVYGKLARLTPQEPRVHLGLGVALAHAGRWDAARGALETVVRLEPGNAAAHLRLGRALERLGRGEEAIPHYREAERLQKR